MSDNYSWLSSYEAYHEKRLADFVNHGERPEGVPESHTLFDSTPNNEPIERPIGASLHLPPFKRWPEDL